jgi:hypothetical protein
MRDRDRIIAMNLAQELGVEMPVAALIRGLAADKLYSDYAVAVRKYLPE